MCGLSPGPGDYHLSRRQKLNHLSHQGAPKQHMFQQLVGPRKNCSEIINYFKLNNNENVTYQNIWGTDKAGLKGKFIAVSVYT